MMYNIIESGKVTNVVEAEEAYADSKGWTQNNGEAIGWVEIEGGFEAPALSASDIKENAIKIYNDALSALEAAYPQKERDTWPQQVTEARAYLADDQAATPLIDAMLTTKPNTTKSELVGKIMTNYTAYSALVGAALGQMQTTIDGIA